MLNGVIVGAVILAGTSGCHQSEREIVLSDLSRSTNLLVTSDDHPISALIVDVRGEVKGSGKIGIKSLWTNVVSGNVDERYSADWFETNCLVIFTPTTQGANGNLRVRVKFSRF